MCKCTPEIRTPFCGKADCVWPTEKRTVEVIMTKGLPASGKTTWAKEFIKDNPGKYKRINKDDLREMLDCSIWSKENEEFVLSIRDYIITVCLIKGINVIIDDTNLNPLHEKRIKEIIKLHNNSIGPASVVRTDIEPPCKATLRIEDIFLTTPLEDCIEKDKKREKPVGEGVIRQMYHQYIKKEINFKIPIEQY